MQIAHVVLWHSFLLQPSLCQDLLGLRLVSVCILHCAHQ